ncbi:hypothetical protein M9Y10_013026 [Tritrichomonas musculus]|uniref:Uncharacterized protein n=1 Tax=Tritrichomonas musculus TaxID=1915356 RepID=A0ABR2I7Q8_9EUKA
MGGIHYYQSDDQHLAFLDFTFTSYTAQKILFKLTKVSQVNEKDNIALLEAQYNDIKNDFNKVISQTKENKRRLFKPGPVSSSHIISRCIGNNKEMIKPLENEREGKVLPVLEKVDQISKQMNEINPNTVEQQIEINNINTIFTEIVKLNETLKERSNELLDQSQISLDIIDQVKQLNDDDGELLEMVNGEIVNEEMKRRAISDLEFEKYIKQFECSNVPDLVNAIFDESTHIGGKFPFLYDISSIFDNYILDQ